MMYLRIEESKDNWFAWNMETVMIVLLHPAAKCNIQPENYRRAYLCIICPTLQCISCGIHKDFSYCHVIKECLDRSLKSNKIWRQKYSWYIGQPISIVWNDILIANTLTQFWNDGLMYITPCRRWLGVCSVVFCHFMTSIYSVTFGNFINTFQMI